MHHTHDAFNCGSEAGAPLPPDEVGQRHALLKATLDSSLDLIQLFTAVRDEAGAIVDFTWVFTNQAAQRVYGDVIGQRLLTRDPDAVPTDRFDTFKRMVETGEAADFEEWHEPTGGWYHVFASPIGGAASRQVAVVFEDVTERKRREANLAFLADLMNDFAPLATAEEIMEMAGKRLAEHLELSRYMFVEIFPEAGSCTYLLPSRPAGQLEISGSFTLADYHTEEEHRLLCAGHSMIVNDVRDGTRTPEQITAFAAFDIASIVNTPYISKGRWVFDLGVARSAPSVWREDEIELLRELSARLWLRIERARAEAALRTSEAKYRTLFESIDEGFCVMEPVRNEQGKIADLIFREINQAFAGQTGLHEAAGKTVNELLPNFEAYLIEIYTRVAATGKSFRSENYVQDVDRWYDTHYSLIGEIGSNLVAVVFDDITERKRREANLAFLAQTSADFVPLASVEEVVASVGIRLARYLNLSRCNFSLVAEAADRITAIYDWRVNDELPSVLGEHQISTFLSEAGRQLYRVGQLAVVNDVRHDPLISAPPELMAHLGIGAVLDAPYVEEGRWKFLLSACRAQASVWRADEIELLRELTARIYIRLERARAEEALCASEEKYRTLFESIDDGFCMIEVFPDARGRVADLILREANEAFAQHTGLDHVIGKRASEVLPQLEPQWLDLITGVYQTGEPVRTEDYSADLDRWLRVYYARVGDRGSPFIAAMFSDISERKRREANLALLAEIAEDFSQLITPDEIMNAVGARLGMYLNLSNCIFQEVDDEGGSVTSHHVWRRENAPNVMQTFRIADYVSDEFTRSQRAGEVFVLRDSAADARADAESYAKLGVRAGLSVPFLRNKCWTACIAVTDTRPRDWQADEIELVGDIAERTFPRIERARAEAALRESEARQTIILETMAEGVVSIDPDGHFLSVNAAAERILGVSKNELIGCSVTEPPFRRFALSGEPWEQRPPLAEVAAAGEQVFHNNYVIERRDGSRVTISRSITTLRVPDGTLLGFVSTLSDITEQQRIEASLRESEERFRAVANLVPDLLWSSEPDGSTNWYNQRWLEYTGQTLEQARGWGWTDAIHPDDRAAATRRYHEAVAAGKPLRQEHRIRQHTGVYRWFVVQAQPVRDEVGNILRWFGAATDIHDQRTIRDTLERHVQERTHELAALSATRQHLLDRLITAQEDERRRIAHDLHDSLGQHLVALDIGLKTVEAIDGFPPAVETRIGALRAMVRHMDTEVERLTVALRPPALDDLGLPDALRRHIYQWGADSDIAVDLHISGVTAQRLPAVVETAIFRIVQEALTNIRKHARATHVSLLLEQRTGELQVIIEDNGQGFDMATVQIVAGERAHLGLNGMRERATLIGGQLEVESTPGVGTTLYLHVPLGEQ